MKFQLYNFKIILQKKISFNIDMSVNFLQSVFRYHSVLALPVLNLVCIGHHISLTNKILLFFWCFLIHYFCRIWGVERSGLHPEIVNESTEFIMFAITNTYVLYRMPYIYTHIYILTSTDIQKGKPASCAKTTSQSAHLNQRKAVE